MNVINYGKNFADYDLPELFSADPTGRLALIQDRQGTQIKWLSPKQLTAAQKNHQVKIILDVGEIAKAALKVVAAHQGGEDQILSRLFKNCQYLQRHIDPPSSSSVGPAWKATAVHLRDCLHGLQAAHMRQLCADAQWERLAAFLAAAPDAWQGALIAGLVNKIGSEPSFMLLQHCLALGHAHKNLALKLLDYFPDLTPLLPQLPLADASTLYLWKKEASDKFEAEALFRSFTDLQQAFIQIDRGGSFLGHQRLDFALPDTALSAEQWELCAALIAAGHAPTLDELQNNRPFSAAVRQRCLQPTLNPQLKYLERAWQAWDSYPWAFKSQPGFLKTLLFIEQNRAWMSDPARVEQAQREGRVVVSHHAGGNLVKIKGQYQPWKEHAGFDTPTPALQRSDLLYTLAFDRTTGRVAFLQGKLAQGGFKRVKKRFTFDARHPAASQMQALGKQTEQLAMAKKEVQLTKACQQVPHVVRLSSHTYTDKSGRAVLVTAAPLYNEGALSDFIGHGKHQRLSLAEKLGIMADILEGVHGIHQQGIVHRDLKLENIFLESGQDKQGRVTWQAVVADLGVACKVDDKKALAQTTGTWSHIPPEVLSVCLRYPREQNQAGDAWAVGMVLYALHYGQHFYDTTIFRDPQRINDAISKYDHVIARQNQAARPPAGSLEEVIWGLLRPKPAERWSLPQALQQVQALR